MSNQAPPPLFLRIPHTKDRIRADAIETYGPVRSSRTSLYIRWASQRGLLETTIQCPTEGERDAALQSIDQVLAP